MVINMQLSCCFGEKDRTVLVTNDPVEAEPNLLTEVTTSTNTYIKENFHSLLFQTMHLACPALIGNLTHKGYSFVASPLLLGLMFRENLNTTDTAFLTLQIVSVALIVAELALNILFPPNLYIHLAVKGLMLFSGFASNGRSIYQGACKIHQSLTDTQLETSTKVAYIASGLVSVSLGTLGCLAVFEHGRRIHQGLQAYQKLDPNQQMFALKYHALESIGEIKQQKAVIINGMSSKWADKGREIFDDTPNPAAYVIYQNYETRTYEVKSSRELASVLNQASKELGRLDHIAFFGHANNQDMVLNANYDFTGNRLEIKAIAKNISDTGDLLLWGCETAQANEFGGSLTEKVSRLLPGHLVTGFGELLYPTFSWVWFDKTVQILAWTKTTFIWDSFTKVFQNGQLLT